jgi:nucleoid DNA-binding protein
VFNLATQLKKVVPQKKVLPDATPAVKSVTPVAKKALPTKVENTTKPVAKPVAKTPAPKPAVAKPVAKTPAPKPAVAKPVAKTPAPKPATKKSSGGKILLGKKKDTKTSFAINPGKRTTRDAFIHICFEKLKDLGMVFESKKQLSEVISVIEKTLIEVTNVSSIKFAEGMFKLRHKAARVYSLKTTLDDILIPEHDYVNYGRYVDETLRSGKGGIRGKFDSETNTFIVGTHNEDGKFIPEKGATPIDLSAIEENKSSAVKTEDAEDTEEEEEEEEDEEVEEATEEVETEEYDEEDEEEEDEDEDEEE